MEPVEEVGDLAGDSVLCYQRDVTLVLKCVNRITASRSRTNMERSPLTPWRGQRECFQGKPSSKITNFISPCHKNTHWLLLETEAGQILQAQCSAFGMFNEQTYPASCGLTNMADMMRWSGQTQVIIITENMAAIRWWHHRVQKRHTLSSSWHAERGDSVRATEQWKRNTIQKKSYKHKSFNYSQWGWFGLLMYTHRCTNTTTDTEHLNESHENTS